MSDHNDVVRHPLVSKIIRAYQNKSAMIKVNVILNNKNWKKFLKYPKSFRKENRNIK